MRGKQGPILGGAEYGVIIGACTFSACGNLAGTRSAAVSGSRVHTLKLITEFSTNTVDLSCFSQKEGVETGACD